MLLHCLEMICALALGGSTGGGRLWKLKVHVLPVFTCLSVTLRSPEIASESLPKLNFWDPSHLDAKMGYKEGELVLCYSGDLPYQASGRFQAMPRAYPPAPTEPPAGEGLEGAAQPGQSEIPCALHWLEIKIRWLGGGCTLVGCSSSAAELLALPPAQSGSKRHASWRTRRRTSKRPQRCVKVPQRRAKRPQAARASQGGSAVSTRQPTRRMPLTMRPPSNCATRCRLCSNVHSLMTGRM